MDVEAGLARARQMGDEIEGHRQAMSDLARQRRELWLELNRTGGVSLKRLCVTMGRAKSYVVRELALACQETGQPRRPRQRAAWLDSAGKT